MSDQFDLNPQYYTQDLIRAASVDQLAPDDVARLFRNLFLTADPVLGQKVLFILLSWLGEYDVSDIEDPGGIVPPLDPNLLQRWAGRREVAALIKTALYADLNPKET